MVDITTIFTNYFRVKFLDRSYLLDLWNCLCAQF